MIPKEDIIPYREFLAHCFETGIYRVWEATLRYEIYVALAMGWDNMVEQKTIELENNLTFLMIGRLN